MIISLISAGSKLLSLPSKRKKSGKDMASSIMKRDQKLLPAGKSQKATSSAIVPKKTTIPTTQFIEPPEENNSIDGIKTKIETLVSMFRSKFFTGKKIDKNKNQNDITQRRKEKEERIEGTKSLVKNPFSMRKIPGESALDGLKRFFTFTLIGFIVNNIQKIIDAIKGFIERLKPVFKILRGFFNKLKDAFTFIRDVYEEHKPKIEKAIDFTKEKYEEFEENFKKFKTQFDDFFGALGGFAQQVIDFVLGKNSRDKKQQPPLSQGTQSLVPQSSLPALPPTGTGSPSLAAAQQYGAPRDDNRDGIPDRKHAGQDFDISGNDQFFSRIGGVVIYAGDSGGAGGYGTGYGNVVDIYNKELDVTERISEAKTILPGVVKGAKIKPGQAVVQGEDITPSGSIRTGVIHYEIRRGRAGASASFEGTLDPVKFLRELDERLQRQSSITPQKSTSVASLNQYPSYSPIGGTQREIYLQRTFVVPV